MATPDKMSDKAVEGDGLSEQGSANVAKSSINKSDTLALAYKDAADILSILDNFGAEQPAANKLPESASLTAEEKNRLAQLLGETGPKIKSPPEEQLPPVKEPQMTTLEEQKIEGLQTAGEISPNDITSVDKEPVHLQSESTEEQESSGIYDRVRSALDSIQGKRDKQSDASAAAEPEIKPLEKQPVQTQHLVEEPVGSDEQEQNISDEQQQNLDADSSSDTKSQIEALTVEREELRRKLDVAEAGIKELENNRQEYESDESDLEQDVESLRLELTRISKWHESMEIQVKKLLKIAENSNKDRETLEINLVQAHEIICTLEKKVQPMQEKLDDYENTINELHNQLVDQTAMLTSTHERLQHEVAQRRKIEQMLRDIKSRLMPLTRKKSTTLPRKKSKKSNH